MCLLTQQKHNKSPENTIPPPRAKSGKDERTRSEDYEALMSHASAKRSDVWSLIFLLSRLPQRVKNPTENVF